MIRFAKSAHRVRPHDLELVMRDGQNDPVITAILRGLDKVQLVFMARLVQSASAAQATHFKQPIAVCSMSTSAGMVDRQSASRVLPQVGSPIDDCFAGGTAYHSLPRHYLQSGPVS